MSKLVAARAKWNLLGRGARTAYHPDRSTREYWWSDVEPILIEASCERRLRASPLHECQITQRIALRAADDSPRNKNLYTRGAESTPRPGTPLPQKSAPRPTHQPVVSPALPSRRDPRCPPSTPRRAPDAHLPGHGHTHARSPSEARPVPPSPALAGHHAARHPGAAAAAHGPARASTPRRSRCAIGASTCSSSHTLHSASRRAGHDGQK